MPLSTTSFKSNTVRCKIMGAMRNAISKGYSQYVTNSKGDNYLRITRTNNTKRAFTMIDIAGNDVTELAYRGLRT